MSVGPGQSTDDILLASFAAAGIIAHIKIKALEALP